MTRETTTEAELRALVREPEQVAVEKVIDHIDAESRRFIEASPLFLLASAAVLDCLAAARRSRA